MTVLIGADPEIFARKQGQLVSAYNLIPGTKIVPHRVDKGAVQVDGMALEFNIDPANTAQQFVGNLRAVLAQLQAMVPEYELDVSPVAEFGHEYIKAQPAEARELGCDPDYNAYTGKANPKPDVDAPFRTASGHVHIGWTNDVDPFHPDHFDACRMLTKELDIVLGIPSVQVDRDTKRRELYGKPGAFRPKPYGMEYRVLSNFWLKSDNLMEWVFETVQTAFASLVAGSDLNRQMHFDSYDVEWYMKDIDESLDFCERKGIKVPYV